MNKHVLEINGATKAIQGNTVLDHISLHFESGKIYGLRGKNGCGKTMLMRAICGLIFLTEGSIVIDGETLGKTISFPKSVGALIENPSFIGGYTGLKNLKILADIQKNIGEEQVRQAIQKVGLDPDDKRKYRKYSLGMKQRLGIAAAIMEHPDLVILDEPINALDENGVVLVRDILHELKEDGCLIILACHDKEELDMLADEIYLMENGKITGHVAPSEEMEHD